MTKAFKQPHIHGSGCLQVDFGVCGQHCLWKSNTHISTPALRLWKCFRMHTLHQIHCPCPCPCRSRDSGDRFHGPSLDMAIQSWDPGRIDLDTAACFKTRGEQRRTRIDLEIRGHPTANGLPTRRFLQIQCGCVIKLLKECKMRI